MTLSVYAKCHYTECRYAKCRGADLNHLQLKKYVLYLFRAAFYKLIFELHKDGLFHSNVQLKMPRNVL